MRIDHRLSTALFACEIGLELARHTLFVSCPWNPERGELGPFGSLSRCILIGTAASLSGDCDLPAVVSVGRKP